MKFHVVSIFPEMIRTCLEQGVLAQGIKKDLFEVTAHQLRDFSKDKHRHIDDRPFGGGDGMLMMAEPLADCLAQIKKNNPDTYVIYVSPQGQVLNENKVQGLAQKSSITFICGRYAGVDQRFIATMVDEEISVGDYVLSGGELAALVMIDAVARKIPGVLGHEDSSQQDSFSTGLLEEAQFTKPREWNGLVVPEILLSGDHSKIASYRLKVSLLNTALKRPDVFAKNAKAIMTKNKISAKDLEIFFAQLTLTEQKALGFSAAANDLNISQIIAGEK